MRNPIFNTLDVISQIDYNLWQLDEISKSKTLTPFEIRKYSMGHLRSIIRNKKNLGYDTAQDEATHREIKKTKVSKS